MDARTALFFAAMLAGSVVLLYVVVRLEAWSTAPPSAPAPDVTETLAGSNSG